MEIRARVLIVVLFGALLSTPLWQPLEFITSAQAEPGVVATPPSGVRWGAAEYEQMAELLAAKKLPLPTLNEAKTKALFERMVSLENLSPANDNARPLNQRVQEFVRMSRSSSEILQHYGTAIQKGERVGAEGARELGFSLRLSQILLKLMDDFLPTLPRDSSYLSRLLGREQMRLGILQQLAGVVTSLGETEIYSTPDRSFLLGELASTVPTLKAVCDPDVRDELKRVLFGFRPLFAAPEDFKRIDAIELELASGQK